MTEEEPPRPPDSAETPPLPSPGEAEAAPAQPQDIARGPIDAPPPPPRSEPAEPPPLRGSGAESRRRWREHAWAAVCHLLLFLVIPTVFLGAVITFFVWQILGRKDAQVEDQGREALNFQINVAALTAILGATCLASPLVPLVWLVALIFCMMAARAAAAGERYRYPWVLRIVTH